jgi:hypothetical protein
MAYWACRSCTVYAQNMNHRMKQMEERLVTINQAVETNAGKITEVDKKVEKISSKLKERDDKADKVAKQTEFNIYEELKERDSRKLNVIIYGVGELTETGCSGKDRLDWDKKSCDNIFRALELELKGIDLKFCRRVGEKGTEPRPMVVGFYTETERAQLLRKAKNLDKTNYSEVNISADLTKRQRDEEKDMKKEAEKRNNLMSESEKAKNLEWIVVGARGEERLIKTVPREQPSRRGGETRGGRGRLRGSRGGITRGGLASGSNSIPIGNGPETTETEMETGVEGETDPETEEEEVVGTRRKGRKRSGDKASMGPPTKR